MQTVATGRLGRVIYAQFSPGEDLYLGLLEVIRKENIKTGMVLDITGGLSKIRLSAPTKVEAVSEAPGFFEMEGSTEVSGHGIVGLTKETYISAKSGIENNAGEPYAHVHVAVCCAGQVHVGHLIEGCTVRSVHEKSHFTVVIAEVEGVELSFRVSEETTPAYPRGIPYHELRQL